MKLFRILKLSTVLIILNVTGYGQTTGCLRGTTVYTQQLAGIWGGRTLSTVCGPGSTAATRYASNVSLLPAPNFCNIDIFGSGTLVRYNEINCPLDSYVILFILPVAAIAIWKIKSAYI
jgi:hypothetical protein